MIKHMLQSAVANCKVQSLQGIHFYRPMLSYLCNTLTLGFLIPSVISLDTNRTKRSYYNAEISLIINRLLYFGHD
jgi:hypothetical protein